MTQPTTVPITVPPPRGGGWRIFAIVAAVLLVVIPGCVVGIMAGFKRSDAFTFSLEEVRRNAEVKTLLGEPLETGMFVLGEINIKNSTGNADLNYSIRGPKGNAEVYVIATRQFSQWTLERVVVDMPESRTRIAVVGSVDARE